MRLDLTKLAVRSLSDKSSQVRKNCIGLLTRLILTHPYGRLHGGELSHQEWQDRYDAVQKELEPLDLPSAEALEAMADTSQDAEDQVDDDQVEAGTEDESIIEENSVIDGAAAEDEPDASMADPQENSSSRRASSKAKRKVRKSDGIDLAAVSQEQVLATLDQNELVALRLKKRYYSDALTFIALLEQAMPTVSDLLASKVKSEVLESMDFFCTAYDYKIEQARIGVSRMLHLVWSKDNSTVEDGKEVRGVFVRDCSSAIV